MEKKLNSDKDNFGADQITKITENKEKCRKKKKM